MTILEVKAAGECRYDLVSLGEVMLRLDPGEGRIRTTREFKVWEGGGEYNVARGLRRCFGMRTAVVTAFADNAVGRLLEDCVLQGGVDTTFVKWVPFDGTGRTVRNGLNFVERGFGIRGALGVSDRGNSAASQMKLGEVDWEELFGGLGVRWFHTGGIFAALSGTTVGVIEEAFSMAAEHGTVLSYDLNYRPSLWHAIGGQETARKVNRSLVRQVDVLFGNEEDYSTCLGIEAAGADPAMPDAPIYERVLRKALDDFPNLKAASVTLRTVKTAGVNDWGAICLAQGKVYEAARREDLEILDRVGGGDGFVSGFIYGLMEKGDPAIAVQYGAAHGALAMTTPGDNSMVTLAEVEKLAAGGGARVER